MRALPINRWSEFKQVLKQLKTDEAHELYSNIIVDTADLAFDQCEKYICGNNGVDKISDIPYGGGFSQCKKEFDEALRSIPQLGFGLVLTSHAQDKTFVDEDGGEYNKIVPTLSNQARLVVDRMSDIIGYARPVEGEDGSIKTMLYMRGTPRYDAGSRFKYTPDYIEFSYENLVNAIGDAIDKQAEESGNEFITDESDKKDDSTVRPFEEVMAEFNAITASIQHAVDPEDFGNVYAPKISAIVSRYLGQNKKVNDCTELQQEQIELIISDLRDEVLSKLEA